MKDKDQTFSSGGVSEISADELANAPEIEEGELLEALKGNIDATLPPLFAVWDFVVKREKPIDDPRWSKKYPREKLVEEDWPLNPGYTKITDVNSPVAVVIPNQDKDLQDVAARSGAAIVGPCVTPNEGPEILISNLVGNPNIRYLIIAGKDSGHMSGDVIKSANLFGIDWKTGRVLETKCPTSPYLKNFKHLGEKGKEILGRFQKQIEIIDMLGCTNSAAVSLVVRLCIQDSRSPFWLANKRNGARHLVYDRGAYIENGGINPIIVKYKELGMEMGWFEGGDRAGTTVFATDVETALKMMRSHTLENGSYVEFESTIKGIDVVGAQSVILDTSKNLVPKGYRPMKEIENDEMLNDYIEKYSTWVYLMPHSNVRLDEESGLYVPYMPESFGYALRPSFEYVYGSQLCCWGWQFLNDAENKEIFGIVEEFQNKHRLKVPSFDQILKFHEELNTLEAYEKRRVIDQLYDVGVKGVQYSVKNNIQAYRLYVSLQDPRLHISKDPTKLHPPCFFSYQFLPRRVKGDWQLDSIFFLRAHAEKAFPSNANGGIKLNKFAAHCAGIKPGVYMHYSSCFQIYSDDLDKSFLEQKRKESQDKEY